MSGLVEKAKALAYRAHAGQVDKAGRPYIEHVARVAAAVAADPVTEAVAWLHDAAEDNPRIYPSIAEMMPYGVLVALDLLDRNVAGDYYARIRKNQHAMRVKLADIDDNSDEARLALLDDKTAARLRRKYAKACKALGVAE